MTAHSSFRDYGVTSTGAKPPRVTVCETNWGYIISSDTDLCNRAALIERVCALAGLIFLVGACGNWLFPQVDSAAQIGVQARFASSIGLAMPALLFLWISDRGMSQEVHVDVVKQCVRRTVCNRNGKTRVLRAVPFDDIESAFIKRAEGARDVAQLFVRLACNKKPLHVTSGREATLRVLHQRLSKELRPVRTRMKGWERVGRRLQPVGA
ncbi:MAG: hypothetical protein WCD16_11690 [Paracoccaceae bacterium]